MTDDSSRSQLLHRRGQTLRVVVAGIILVACSTDKEAAPRGADAPRIPAAAAVPPDTLVLTTTLGEVWLTDARESRDSTDARCLERVIEIRRDTVTIRVPLLYTGAAPILANDSTLRADLWLHCRPRASYAIDLRTGRPSPLGR